MNIGEIIKEQRKAKGLTQQELAQLVGLTQPAIGKYESGKRKPPFEVIEQISSVLGVNILHADTDIKHDLFALLCNIRGFAVESKILKEEDGNSTLMKPCTHIDNGEKDYLITNMEINNLIDSFIPHLLIEFDAFVEKLNEYQSENKEV